MQSGPYCCKTFSSLEAKKGPAGYEPLSDIMRAGLLLSDTFPPLGRKTWEHVYVLNLPS